MKSKTREISKKIRDYINMIDASAEVILYGSRARGDEREYSDWDILILTDYPTDLAVEGKFRDKLYDLELETGESFSVFAYSKSEWYATQKSTPFFANVTSEGVLI
jgi:predicted nucleotidyltransferase